MEAAKLLLELRHPVGEAIRREEPYQRLYV